MSKTFPTMLPQTLADQAEEIAEAVRPRVSDYFADGGSGQHLPDDQLVSVLVAILRRSVTLFQANRTLESSDLEWCSSPAVQLAEQGKRIAPVLQAWQQGCAALLAECWARTPPGGQAAMSAYTTWVTEAVRTIIRQLGIAYAEAQKQAGLECPPRRVLAELMINGAVSPELACAARHTFTDDYVVLVARLADGALVGPVTVARAAGALAPGDLGLCCQIENRLCVLAPLGWGGSAAGVGERVISVLRRAELCFDGPAGLVKGQREHLAEAVQRASGVVALATAAGIATPMVQEEELVSELAISRDRHFRDNLSRLMDPLADYPELIETLNALYAHDLDRTRTAKVLNVVRRTLSYRLEKIEQLTGLSPVRPRGIQIFTLALAARNIG